MTARFEDQEESNNAINVSDTKYIGVGDDYRKVGPSFLRPLDAASGPQHTLEEAAKASEAALLADSETVGFQGFTSDVPHPASYVAPATPFIEQNRTILENQANA